jgi:hypothetical protein
LEDREKVLVKTKDKAIVSSKVGIEASMDVCFLHDKVDRKKKILKINVNKTKKLKDKTSDSFITFVQNVESINTSNNEKGMEFITNMNTMTKIQADNHSKMNDILINLNECHKSNINELMTTNVPNHQKKLVHTLVKNEKKNIDYINSLRNIICKQKEQNHAMKAMFLKYVTTTNENITNYMNSNVKQEIQNVNELISQSVESEKERQHTIILNLKSQLASVQKELKEHKLNTINSLKESNTKYCELHEKRMNQTTTMLRDNVPSMIKEYNDNVHMESKKNMQESNNMLESMKQKMMELFSQMNAFHIEKFANTMENSTKHTNQMMTNIDESMQTITNCSQEEKNYVENEFVANACTNVSDIVTRGNDSCQSIVSIVEEEACKTNSKWKEVAKDANKKINQMNENIQNTLQQWKDHDSQNEQQCNEINAEQCKTMQTMNDLVKTVETFNTNTKEELETVTTDFITTMRTTTDEQLSNFNAIADDCNKQIIVMNDINQDHNKNTSNFIAGMIEKGTTDTNALIKQSEGM